MAHNPLHGMPPGNGMLPMGILPPEEPIMPMTQRAQEVLLEQNQPLPTSQEKEEKELTKEQKKLHEDFKSRIEACKSYRKKLIQTWTSNIDMRRGKSFASQTDDNRINVPIDWSYTKTKQASLFSQVPQARIVHTPETLQALPWLLPLERRANDTLVKAGIEAAMDEVLPDVINAAGIGAVLVSYEAIQQNKEVPAIDMATLPPEFQQEALTQGTVQGQPIEMETVPEVVDHRYVVTRISPSDLLWPITFFGSDFNNAPWIGRTGRISWPQAVQRFGLTEEEKDKVLGDDRTTMDRLTHDQEKDRIVPDEIVSFDEIFYKEYEFHTDAVSYDTIHHLVFVEGKKNPVIDQVWEGQREDEAGIVGSFKFPIQCLTLTYITDETIPPSDSAMGRPQVTELNKSRSQMIKQRDRNLPVRWMNINRVDPTLQVQLMRGEWGAIVPVNGRGDDILGEVAKSQFPGEDFTFDQIAKGDLAETWSLGPNQIGSGAGVETKGEGDTIQSNFQTRLGRERAKVAKFFCSIAEILTGLLVLYEEPESFGEGFDPAITKTLCYSILADSTVLLDANQRMEKLTNFVNFAGKSGFLNIEPVLQEIAQLTGLDPTVVVQAPQPKPPVEPNISLRLTGSEDLTNPLVLAFLLKSGQAPEPELVEQAKQLISMVVIPKAPPLPPQVVMNADGSHEVISEPESEAKAPVLEGYQLNLEPMPPAPPEVGPDGQPLEPGMEGEEGMEPPMGPEVPQPAPPQVGEANPRWSLMDRINKREEGGQE